MTSKTTTAQCLSGTPYKLSPFEKLIGGWKDLKHKQ
jgi:hypothetical protein